MSLTGFSLRSGSRNFNQSASGASFGQFNEAGAQSAGSFALSGNYSRISVGAGASQVANNSAGAESSVDRIARDLLALGGSLTGAAEGARKSASVVNLSAAGRSSASAATAAGGSRYLSEIEEAILRSQQPIELNEQQEIEVNGQRGIWANRNEVVNWRGVIPITEYVINEDSNPEVITKRSSQQLEYIQELAIRYLRPPTPPAPGEIIITQEANTLTPPAPPLIIRQQPARPETPEPLVIREAPPQAPAQVGRKVITISGKRIPPPPRKVVIERLAQLPSKPQSVLIERWLPYAQVKRRVIFNKPTQADPVVVKPRNIIVQWEAPQVNVKKEYKYLGVIRANPAEYVQRYGTSLLASADLPSFVQDIKTPDGLVLAANYTYNSLHELYGDLEALKLVNLDAEGLGEYRAYLQRLGVLDASGRLSANASRLSRNASAVNLASASSASFKATQSSADLSARLGEIIEKIFRSINTNGDGRITIEDAEKAVLRLNSRLGRRYGEDDVKAFFVALDTSNTGFIDLESFKKAFLNLRI